MSCARRMMGMRLMRVMYIMMRIVQIMMRIVNIVMRTMDSMMGIMNGRMGSVTGHKRVGQAERIRVSLITISDSWAAACRHVIPW